MAGRGKREKWLYLLVEGDASKRREAAKKLGEMGDATTVPALISALSDPTWRVRRNAAQALGQIGDTRAVEPLIALLSDVSLGVRRKATISLGQLANPRAVEPLCAQLQEDAERLGAETAVALKLIGPTSVLGLCRILDDSQNASNRLASQIIRFIAYDQRKGFEVLQGLLECEQLTAEQRYRGLETLRRVRPFFWTPDILGGPVDRYCLYLWQSARRDIPPVVRKNAQAVLDYMTLARASDGSAATGSDVLLRAAQSSTSENDGTKTFLRGSQAGSPLETSGTRPGLWARLRERFRLHRI